MTTTKKQNADSAMEIMRKIDGIHNGLAELKASLERRDDLVAAADIDLIAEQLEATMFLFADANDDEITRD